MLTFDDLFRYYFFIGLIFLQSFIFYAKKPTNISNFTYLFLVFMELFIVIGLRSSSVGFDTYRYLYLFDYISGTSEIPINYMESGFLQFTYLLTLISSYNQILLITSGFIIVLSSIFFIYKYSKIPWFSVYIYINTIFLFQLSGMRQALSMSFTMLSFYFIEKRNFLLFVIMIIIAMQFHTAALLFLPAYFLFNIGFNKKNILIAIAIFAWIFLYFQIFSDAILNFFPNYEVYLYGEWKNEDIKIASIFKTIIAGFYILFGTIIWFKIKIFLNKKSYMQIKLLLWFSFFSFLIQFISINATQLSRIALYFSYFNIILYPNLIALVKDKNTKILLIGLFVFFVILYTSVILWYRNAWVGCLPYTFFCEI